MVWLVRAVRRYASPAVLTICLAVLLTGCARPNGDFDRADRRHYITHDWLAPMAGTLTMSALRTELVSRLNYTERDARLRSASWGLVLPPHHNDWLGQAKVELARTRFLNPLGLRMSKHAYHRNLRRTRYASSAARWNRLISDLESDLSLVDPFYDAARATISHDRVRLQASAQLSDTPKWNARHIGGRVKENDVIISWTLNSLDLRYASYHHAYTRLLAEEPPEDLATAERAYAAIARLHAAISAALADLDGVDPSLGYGRAPVVTK